MPNSLVKSYADKSGNSVEEVDRIWKEISDKVKSEYKDKSESERYAIINGIVRNILGLNESIVEKAISLLTEVVMNPSFDLKTKRQKQLGLKSIGYGNFKNIKGDVYRWDESKKDFLKSGKYDEKMKDVKREQRVDAHSGTVMDFAKGYGFDVTQSYNNGETQLLLTKGGEAPSKQDFLKFSKENCFVQNHFDFEHTEHGVVLKKKKKDEKATIVDDPKDNG